MHWRVGAIIGVITLIGLGLFIPVTQRRVISYGTDSYLTHTPLFAHHTSTVDFTTTAKTVGIGSVFVNLRHAKNVPTVHIAIQNAQSHAVLLKQTIPPDQIHDDQFAIMSFPEHLISAHQRIQIIYSAPEGTVNNPIGLRYEKNTRINSFVVLERVPIWQAFTTIIQNKPDTWRVRSISLLGALVLVLISLLVPKKNIGACIAILFICIGFAISAQAIIPQLGGVSGGDAYDYLGIAQSITRGENPLLHSKRLPGYPILLIPTFISHAFDDQYVMRFTGAIGGVTSLILIALIAHNLTKSWPIGVASAGILAFQKDFLWTALRPEPYAVYTALLLASVYLFLVSYEKKSTYIQVVFGLTLGYSAMTRQEGFVLAIVLGLLSLLHEIKQYFSPLYQGGVRGGLFRIASMYLPALLIISPFLITNTIAHHNPFHTNYLEGDRLQIVDSYLAFQDSLGATWGIVGSMWKSSWDQLERLPLNGVTIITSIIGLLAWYAYRRFALQSRIQVTTATILLITSVAILLISIYYQSVFTANFAKISAGFILASIPLFLLETKWKGAVILLVLLSQIGIATWFHPFPKHYEQSYPLIVLIIATAFLSRIPQKKYLQFTATLFFVLPFFITAGILSQKLNAQIDRQNEDSALDSVTYRSARYARSLTGPIGFDQAYLPARLYFDPNALYFPDEDNPTLQMEDDWLKNNPVKILVVSNGNNVFKKPRSNWTPLVTFKSAGSDEKIFESTIYKVE